MDVLSLDSSYKRFFGHECRPKIDTLMTVVMGRPVLDMGELDRMLHAKHGMYEETGLSMQGLILREYGPECLSFCKDALAL